MKSIKILTAAIFAAVTLSSCDNNRGGDSLDYIPVKTKKDASWSLIGPDGKFLYEDEFENTPSMVLNGYFKVEENGGVAVYKAADKEPVLVPGCEDLVDAGFMSAGQIPIIRKNERITFVDTSGKDKFILMPVGGKEIVKVSALPFHGYYGILTEDDKWGTMDPSGKIIITPQYDNMCSLGEGMMFALNTTDDGVRKYLITTDGKEVFKTQDDFEICSGFIGGNMLVKKNDVPGYINKKGEFTKLPSKIDSFMDNEFFSLGSPFFNGKEFIFESKDGYCGVMNLKGEVVIRAKYDGIFFYPGNRYLAYAGKSKIYILNASGEREKTFDDFTAMIPLQTVYPNTKFQLLALETDGLNGLYSFEGKPVSQESFLELKDDVFTPGTVSSDYFDVGDIVKSVTELINDNGVNGIAFGTPITDVIPDNVNPQDYRYKTYYVFSDVAKGLKWNIEVSVVSFMALASSIADSYDKYEFNPDATIEMLSIVVNTQEECRDDAAEQIVSVLKKRGFSEKDIPEEATDVIAYLAKDNEEVVIYTSDKGNGMYIHVGHTN